MRSAISLLLALAVAFVLTGCSSTPPPPSQTFLSDYSKLDPVNEKITRYMSPEIENYKSFIVDPPVLRPLKDPPILTPDERAQIADYWRTAAIQVLEENGATTTTQPGVGVARIRLAVTDVRKAKWYLKLHPASKLAGAGLGAATLEAEVIDSVTGEQIVASVTRAKGDQFQFDQFNSINDVQDVIDIWAEDATEALNEIRAERMKAAGQ